MHVILLTSGRIFGVPHGGEDRFTNSLGNWLARDNNKVTLIGIDYAGLRVRHLSSSTVTNPKRNQRKKPARNQSEFGLVLVLRYISYSLRMIIWLFQVLRILSINLRSKITMINAQDSGYTGLAAIIASKILGIPVIISLHGIRYKEIESNPFLNKTIKKLVLKLEKKIDILTLKNADLITVVSPSITWYVNQVVPNKPVEILPVAIKTEKFIYSQKNRDLVRSQLGIDNKAIVVGYVGRLSFEKNLFMLLESFANASIDDPLLMLILVGDGPLEFELKKRADELNIRGKVIFGGVREDVGAVLSSFDIFVLPSFIEGLSNALLEAMTAGRAIICSDIQGNRELVTNNKDGLLINPKNPASLSSCIGLLSQDALLRQKLGDNARIKARQFDESTVFPRILKYYLALSRIPE